MFTSLRQLAAAVESASNSDLPALLRRYSQPKLLIIDEVGYTRLTPAQAQLLFELVTLRYERGSIILTSNLSFSAWGDLLGDGILASALLDRLLHHAEVISINGRSYRLRQRLVGDEPSGVPAAEVAAANGATARN